LNAAVVQTISESQSDLGVRASTTESVSAERLQPGARIRVRGFSKPVIFRRLDGSSAEIEAGPLRMKVAVDEIVGVEGAAAASKNAPPASKGSNVTVSIQPSAGSVSDEINVIGLTVEQATELVDKFLDDAALAHKARVRIIHGHGTGALRRGLAEFLKGHTLVESIASERPDRGGAAITIAELRV
jgi:DNA mismatch repair protein MutS2